MAATQVYKRCCHLPIGDATYGNPGAGCKSVSVVLQLHIIQAMRLGELTISVCDCCYHSICTCCCHNNCSFHSKNCSCMSCIFHTELCVILSQIVGLGMLCILCYFRWNSCGTCRCCVAVDRSFSHGVISCSHHLGSGCSSISLR